jgi:iron complex transport system substrate-binding protein
MPSADPGVEASQVAWPAGDEQQLSGTGAVRPADLLSAARSSTDRRFFLPRPFRSVLVTLSVLVSLAAGTVALEATAAAAPKKPERIVSLSPTATEMLFAIGAGKQVVAVDDQSDFPKGVPTTDLSGFEPNVEAIAGYQPDLVVVSDSGVADQLRGLGIEVLVEPAAKRLADAYKQINQLGKATGHTAKARQVAEHIRREIAKVKADVPDRKGSPTVYWELDDTYFSADSSTFIGQLLEMAGLKNIADKAGGSGGGYPQLSSEYVVQSNPDVVFLADTQCCNQTAKTFAQRPGLDQVRAVTKHHVVPMSDDIASRWGPRVVDLFRKIVRSTKKL